MTRRLAWRETAVVACSASASGYTGMTEFCPTEYLGRVACFTTHLRRQMRLWLHNIVLGQTQTTGMTTGTVTWRTLEYAADVT